MKLNERCLLLLAGAVFSLSSFAWDKAEVKWVSKERPFFADDGSIIRNMPQMGEVQSVHCRLPAGKVIQACRHKTVSQIWYVTAGSGEMWLKSPDGTESITAINAGTALTVPLGYSFQFRNTAKDDLDIFIVNTSAWSGSGELIPVGNYWAPSFPRALR